MKNIQNNNGKKNPKKSSDPWARSGERPGRGHGSELFVFFCFFFVFLVFPWFFAVWPKPREHKKNQKKQKVQTHGQGLGYPHTNQKTKKPKNQETKKPKNQKNKKPKNKKNKIAHPKGRGSDAECWVLSFCFFGFFGFLVFWQFGQNLENTKKNKKKQKVQTHGQGLGYPHTNQKTKKPKNQETKKPKKQKTKKQKKPKKPRLHTPRGGGQMQSVGSCLFVFFVFFVFLVFCFFGFLFFWFFGLCVDSHCRCAKQRLPGTVSGCARSKVDTLQYSNVCYDIVHSANEQQRGMEFNFVRLRHMLLDLCTGNAAICALPQWPVL